MTDGPIEFQKADDLTDYLAELYKRLGMITLFSVVRKADKEDVEKTVKIIGMSRGVDDDN